MVLFSKGKVWHIDFRNAKLPKHSSSQVIFRYCDMHLCTIGQKHTDSISDKLYTSLSFDKFSTDAQETSNISNFTSFQRFECWYLFAIFWNSSMFRVRSDKLYTSLSCDRFFTDAQETSNISKFTSFHRFECRNLFAIFLKYNHFLMVPMCRLGWHVDGIFWNFPYVFLTTLFLFIVFLQP